MVENAADQSNTTSPEQRLNSAQAATSASPKQSREVPEIIPDKSSEDGTSSRPRTTSDEHQPTGGRSRRTGNRSGKDSRRAGAAAKQARENPTAGRPGVGRKSEMMQSRSMKGEITPPQAGVGYQPQGPTLSRVIYTSDRRTRSAGNDSAERLSSVSSTTALPAVTGRLYSTLLYL